MIKVAFFEDHPIVINSLKILIENNFELTFYAETKNQLYYQLKINSEIDVLILDLIADDVVGYELFEYVNKNYPKIKTIAFTSISSTLLI